MYIHALRKYIYSVGEISLYFHLNSTATKAYTCCQHINKIKKKNKDRQTDRQNRKKYTLISYKFNEVY